MQSKVRIIHREGVRYDTSWGVYFKVSLGGERNTVETARGNSAISTLV